MLESCNCNYRTVGGVKASPSLYQICSLRRFHNLLAPVECVREPPRKRWDIQSIPCLDRVIRRMNVVGGAGDASSFMAIDTSMRLLACARSSGALVPVSEI